MIQRKKNSKGRADGSIHELGPFLKSFRMFADTNMFYTSDKLQHLETVMNEELKLVFKYWITNKLSINLADKLYGNLIFKRLNESIHIHNIEQKKSKI